VIGIVFFGVVFAFYFLAPEIFGDVDWLKIDRFPILFRAVDARRGGVFQEFFDTFGDFVGHADVVRVDAVCTVLSEHIPEVEEFFAFSCQNGIWEEPCFQGSSRGRLRGFGAPGMVDG
jgi:hypothetical protein